MNFSSDAFFAGWLVAIGLAMIAVALLGGCTSRDTTPPGLHAGVGWVLGSKERPHCPPPKRYVNNTCLSFAEWP